MRCFVSKGHTINMNDSPRLSMGAAAIDSPLVVDMARPRQMTASRMIQMIAWPNVTKRLRQQRRMNLTI